MELTIRIETRFAVGDRVWVETSEESRLAVVCKMQYIYGIDGKGRVAESLMYKVRYLGSGKKEWIKGNVLIRRYENGKEADV